MRIALVTPAARGARSGNRHTALRWAAFLRAAGHRVTVAQRWSADPGAQMMIALHARRSHDSIRRFAEAYPDKPIVLALTGTDVYRDIRTSKRARDSLEMATRFIVLQAQARDELPPRFRARANVVLQSSGTRLRHAPVQRTFRVCVIGHLRDEKDPLRTLAALAHLPQGLGLEVVQLGRALDAQLARRARAAMRAEPRYRWLGSLPHARALRWLASSHVMVISSRMEGGANVVSEAIRVGVPVIASRIPGNVGLLGARYPAYFTFGDERKLAALLQRSATDLRFYRELKRRIAALRPDVMPGRESRGLLDAVRRVAGGQSGSRR